MLEECWQVLHNNPPIEKEHHDTNS
jgi:hypothetical protein